MSQGPAEGRNVSMYPSDWAVVESADKFDAGISATLRMIVREWATMAALKRRTLTDPRAPYVIETGCAATTMAGGMRIAREDLSPDEEDE